jgi:pimeloyl-ACP methyl ester carboxylesterase
VGRGLGIGTESDQPVIHRLLWFEHWRSRGLGRRNGAARPKSSRGGRPDLAGHALARVQAPTLLIVGGHDEVVLQLNTEAQRQMRC